MTFRSFWPLHLLYGLLLTTAGGYIIYQQREIKRLREVQHAANRTMPSAQAAVQVLNRVFFREIQHSLDICERESYVLKLREAEQAYRATSRFVDTLEQLEKQIEGPGNHKKPEWQHALLAACRQVQDTLLNLATTDQMLDSVVQKALQSLNRVNSKPHTIVLEKEDLSFLLSQLRLEAILACQYILNDYYVKTSDNYCGFDSNVLTMSLLDSCPQVGQPFEAEIFLVTIRRNSLHRVRATVDGESYPTVGEVINYHRTFDRPGPQILHIVYEVEYLLTREIKTYSRDFVLCVQPGAPSAQ